MDASVKPERKHIEGEKNLYEAFFLCKVNCRIWQATYKDIVLTDSGTPNQVYTFTPIRKGVATLTFVYR
jgi:hypothetical protein